MRERLVWLIFLFSPAVLLGQEKGVEKAPAKEKAGPPAAKAVLHYRQPADAILAFHRNVLRMRPEDRYYARAAWVSEVDPKIKRVRFQAASGLANGTSTRSRIAVPVLILANGEERKFVDIKDEEWAQVELLRFKGNDYGDQWLTAWDKLGDPKLEPLFHVNVPYPAGKYTDGSTYKAGVETYFAPWLIEPLGLPKEGPQKLPVENTYQRALVELAKMTGSPCPVVEVRNLVWQMAIQERRPAGYYDFLGITNQKDFERIIGFDEKLSLRFRQPQLESVKKSGVARQPRGLEIWDALGGPYLRTRDQVDDAAIGDRNPLSERNLGLGKLKFAATEVFAGAPNGWWLVGLFNADGTRQDSAPDGVGYNHGSVTNDGKIHINLTCFSCHDAVAGNAGMQPFKPFFRNLYVEGGKVALTDYLKKRLEKLEDQYLTPIDLEAAQQRYVKAVHQATGLTPDKYALALVDTFHSWDRSVSREEVARRHGVSQEELVKALERALDPKNSYPFLDSVNADWLSGDQTDLGVDQFSESYNLVQLVLRGLPIWPPEMRIKYRGK